MPNVFTNSLKDFLGIIRAVSYRTFIQRKWKPPQPMFNILQIKEGTDTIFDTFLEKSLVLSLKRNTPISFGPFKSEKDRTYIYITHYASTPAFIKVVNGLLFHGLSKLRAKATLKTSWTYASAVHEKNYENTTSIILIGMEQPADFENFISEKNLEPMSEIHPIKDVRGRSLKKYWAFELSEEAESILTSFKPTLGVMQFFKAMKLPN